MILLFLIVWGLFAGWIANLILGGGMRPDNWGRLLVAGVVRSFVGGLLSNLLADDGAGPAPVGTGGVGRGRGDRAGRRALVVEPDGVSRLGRPAEQAAPAWTVRWRRCCGPRGW